MMFSFAKGRLNHTLIHKCLVLGDPYDILLSNSEENVKFLALPWVIGIDLKSNCSGKFKHASIKDSGNKVVSSIGSSVL